MYHSRLIPIDPLHQVLSHSLLQQLYAIMLCLNLGALRRARLVPTTAEVTSSDLPIGCYARHQTHMKANMQSSGTFPEDVKPLPEDPSLFQNASGLR